MTRRRLPIGMQTFRELPIHLVGVEFSSASRNVVAFDHEMA